MRGFQRLRDLLRDGDCLLDRNRSSCDPLIETLPVDEFEHEELRAVRFIKAVNSADVGMVQRGEDLGLPAESGEPLGIVRERGRKDFQRDVATELGVRRAIDLPHAAAANQRQNLITAETGACGQGHESRAIVATVPVAAKGNAVKRNWFSQANVRSLIRDASPLQPDQALELLPRQRNGPRVRRPVRLVAVKI